jgi:hypothetical protein
MEVVSISSSVPLYIVEQKVFDTVEENEEG